MITQLPLVEEYCHFEDTNHDFHGFRLKLSNINENVTLKKHDYIILVTTRESSSPHVRAQI